MVHELEELPLLPLNTVLFPYAQLQMHVSEERHRQMVRACVEYDRPFGIVLIRPGSDQVQSEPYLVGTAVRIMAVHTYEDGQMDVQVQGERRFRVRELDESRPYLVARVEPLIELEIDETPESEALFFKAREDCQLLVQRRFEQQGFSVRVEFPPDP
ncbi:MAG: LON peptidase substrate-binding domain-containing protein, partial [Fimbriimonas ginsengisoli]|nr:LON peptidase substrate-binding domain-containing protein [Fimbriimonas ginsengisoli]